VSGLPSRWTSGNLFTEVNVDLYADEGKGNVQLPQFRYNLYPPNAQLSWKEISQKLFSHEV
jgi:hypothetical protein